MSTMQYGNVHSSIYHYDSSELEKAWVLDQPDFEELSSGTYMIFTIL